MPTSTPTTTKKSTSSKDASAKSSTPKRRVTPAKPVVRNGYVAAQKQAQAQLDAAFVPQRPSVASIAPVAELPLQELKRQIKAEKAIKYNWKHLATACVLTASLVANVALAIAVLVR